MNKVQAFLASEVHAERACAACDNKDYLDGSAAQFSCAARKQDYDNMNLKELKEACEKKGPTGYYATFQRSVFIC